MWVYQAADPDSLAEAIGKLIHSADCGRAMAETGRREVSELYDMPVISQRIEAFLKKVVESP